MKVLRRVCLLSVFFLAGRSAVLRADVTLAPLFTDHAVLQREKPVPIWGRADAGEKVTVTFAGQIRSATAGKDGKWILFLEPLATAAQGTDLSVVGRNTLTVHDVVVGEVWLCSGQSNMEWTLNEARDAEREIAAARFPLIRHLKVRNTVSATPAETVTTGGWQPASPDVAGGFTAIGYFFARDIHQKVGVPVGIVNSTWGGTPVESWMSAAALASDPAFRVVSERWQQNLTGYPAQKTAYEAAMVERAKAEDTAKARGPQAYAAWLKQNPRPRGPRGPGDSWTPGGLFNGMINPLLPYGIRGVLWYQGESNAERASDYHALFSAMIVSWRAHFGQPDLPFYWVSLANYGVEDQTNRTYAFLREAQTKTLALPNTGQALAIDIGDAKDIHPTNKQEVGRRLALLAKNRIYHITCDDTGPSYTSATREGANVRVHFAHAASGLVAHDKPVQSLEVAGSDKVFHPASGRIERDTLLISSPAVKLPIAVRYAWVNAPEANLYNGAGLPAVPFRSDDW